MDRTDELEAAVKLGKAWKRLAREEATKVNEATQRVKLRYDAKREQLLEGVPDEVLKLAGLAGIPRRSTEKEGE